MNQCPRYQAQSWRALFVDFYDGDDLRLRLKVAKHIAMCTCYKTGKRGLGTEIIISFHSFKHPSRFTVVVKNSLVS